MSDIATTTEVKPPILFEEALAEFRAVWTKWDLLGDLGERLTCTESDALADFLEALGEADAAKGLREAHAEGDDEGDSHFSGETEEDI